MVESSFHYINITGALGSNTAAILLILFIFTLDFLIFLRFGWYFYNKHFYMQWLNFSVTWSTTGVIVYQLSVRKAI